MVGREQQRAGARNVLGALALQTEVDEEKRHQDRPRRPVENRVHTARDGASAKALQGLALTGPRGSVARSRVARGRLARSSAAQGSVTRCSVSGTSGGLAHHVLDYPRARGPLQWCKMAIDRAKTIRGALAGALAAGVWAAQLPLDKRIFGTEFDDVELLGKAVTRRAAWPLAGWALHLQNGALFGALYANLAPRVPLPSWTRGPVAALGENFATWPLFGLADRLHPAREELPAVFSNRRALAQSTWRHVLFGVVLGELERRLNAPEQIEPPDYLGTVSSNGHGHIEHLAAAR